MREDVPFWPDYMVSDGLGGAIIANHFFSDEDNGYLLHVARISSKGEFLWIDNGVPKCLRVMSSQQSTDVENDNSGGALIVWERKEDSSIFAQRVSPEGNIMWPEGGARVSKGTKPKVSTDSMHGAFVAWVSAQRMGADGKALWAEAPSFHAQDTDQQFGQAPYVVCSGSGEAIITWSAGVAYLYAQKIDAEGIKLWPETGVRVHGSDCFHGSRYGVLSDGAGGVIVVWEKRTGEVTQGGKPIYAQRINADGENCWGTDGVMASPGHWGFTMPPVVSEDGSGGVIISWTAGSRSHTDLTYIQRINAEGERLWGKKGAQLSP